jgi:hypothetical protein
MTIVSAVIRKTALVERYARPRNPYELALLFCLERSRDFLDQQIKGTGATHVVCEARSERKKDGKVGREDHELELEFRRIVAGIHSLQPDDGSGAMPNFDIVFASKRANSSGLQLADLVARPIGLSVLKPAQDNRAFEIIRNKILKSGAAEEPAFGLKIFP